MKQRITLLMLALVAAFTSCNKEAEFSNVGNGMDKIAAEFSSQIQTRAAGNSWSVNDKIGVFMVAEGKILSEENIVNSADNIAYKTAVSGTNGNFSVVDTTKKIYFPAKDNVDFISYYPYSQSVNNYVYPVDVSDQSSQEAIDLLYSNNAKGKNSSTASVAFNFKHKLSKLAIKISGDAYTEKELAAVVVKIKGLNTMASFSLKIDSIIMQSKVGDIAAKTVTAGKAYEAIVLPTTSLSNVVIEFTIAGKTLSWDITTAAFVKGNRYNYNLVLGRNDVTIGDSTIEDWEDNPAPDVKVKKIHMVSIGNMLIQYTSKQLGGERTDNIVISLTSSRRGSISLEYASSTVMMQGTMPNPAAISYSGKEQEDLNFIAKYTLNESGLASLCSVTILDSLKRVKEKYTMEYGYNVDNQLISVVQKDEVGKKIAECTATWKEGNLTDCKMGFYLQHAESKPDSIKPNSIKLDTDYWEEMMETYTYDSRVNQGCALIPLILPTIYYSEDVIGVLASSIGLLGKGPKNYLSRRMDSDGYIINIAYSFSGLYPITAIISTLDPNDTYVNKVAFDFGRP